ncbi:MAG: hypothetical protein IPF41_06175 [Flavobacteriales bacterium]|nr:hypothetical protein [Flavobacteriales bacterium]
MGEAAFFASGGLVSGFFAGALAMVTTDFFGLAALAPGFGFAAFFRPGALGFAFGFVAFGIGLLALA